MKSVPIEHVARGWDTVMENEAHSLRKVECSIWDEGNQATVPSASSHYFVSAWRIVAWPATQPPFFCGKSGHTARLTNHVRLLWSKLPSEKASSYTASKIGRQTVTLWPPWFLRLHRSECKSSMTFLVDTNKVGRLRWPWKRQICTKLPHNSALLPHKALAAFPSTMSEPPHQLAPDWNDWSNVDLLDACYDPMHDGMGLDRWVFFLPLANKKGVGRAAVGANNPRPFYIAPAEPGNIESCLEAPMATIDHAPTALERNPETLTQ